MPVPTDTEKTNTSRFTEESISSRGKAQQDDTVFSIQHLFELQGDKFAVRVPSNYHLTPNASMLFALHLHRLSATTLENSWNGLLVFEAMQVEDDASPRSAHWAFAALSPSEVSASTGWAQLLTRPTAVPTVDSLDVNRQLTALKDLQDGWADGVQLASQWGEGYGKAPSPQGLDWLAGWFAAHYTKDLPRPYLYPTPEGGVQAEWSIRPHEASLEIDLVGHSAEWHCLNLTTGHSTERRLDLASFASSQWIVREIRKLESTPE